MDCELARPLTRHSPTRRPGAVEDYTQDKKDKIAAVVADGAGGSVGAEDVEVTFAVTNAAWLIVKKGVKDLKRKLGDYESRTGFRYPNNKNDVTREHSDYFHTIEPLARTEFSPKINKIHQRSLH